MKFAQKWLMRPMLYGLALACVWHFLIWPVLNHHFPQYAFPPLRVEWIARILPLLGLGG